MESRLLHLSGRPTAHDSPFLFGKTEQWPQFSTILTCERQQELRLTYRLTGRPLYQFGSKRIWHPRPKKSCPTLEPFNLQRPVRHPSYCNRRVGDECGFAAKYLRLRLLFSHRLEDKPILIGNPESGRGCPTTQARDVGLYATRFEAPRSPGQRHCR